MGIIASGILRYLIFRALILVVTTIIAIYLTILIANMGGQVDEIVKAELLSAISESVRNDPSLKGRDPAFIQNIIMERYNISLRTMGLDKPFYYRSFMYLWDAITLNLGRAWRLTSDSGSRQVRIIILERLPATILLFTSIQLILFFSSLFVGLYLSRRYGSKLDRLVVLLAPLSSMPGWFYGIFLIIIFASTLRVLPYGGMVDAPPPQDPLLYALSILKHMILPMMSWFIAYFIFDVYSMRTFFLIFSSEDYVELAKAKGLPSRIVERRYILRPAMPPIITSLALTLIASWMGAIITERVFNWPGIGSLLSAAISANDPPVVIGIVTVYAYLLAVTIFVLDIVYVLIDPRIRLVGRE